MKLLRRVSLAIALLFITLLVVSAIVVNKPELVKPIINDLVSSNLDRPFEIKGDIELSVYPKLIIDLENIHLANPEWSNRPDMLVVEKIHLDIDLKRIFSNNADIPQFQAQGIRVFLEKNTEDKANWQFTSETTKDKESSSVSLFESQVTLQDVTFQYTDVNKPIINGYISDFNASLTRQAGLMAILNGTIQDRALKLSIVSGKEVAADQAFPLTGTFDLGGEARGNLDGDLGWPLRTAATALRFGIEGNNLQKLGQLLNIPEFSDPDPYYLKAEINASEQGIALKDIDSVVGQISLAGDLALTMGKQAKLTSNLKLSINEQYKDLHIKLDIDTDEQALQTDKPIPLDGKLSLNDIAEFDVDGIFAWPLRSEATKLDIVLKGNDLSKMGQFLAIEQLSYPESYYLKAAINASEQGITLNNIDSVVGEMSLTGDLALIIAEQTKLTSDIKLSINEQYKDLRIKLDINADTKALQTDKPIPLDGKVSLNDIAELDVDGTFAWPLSGEATKLDLILKGNDLSKVGQFLEIEQLSEPEPYYLKAAINANDHGIALSQIDASIGRHQLAGTLGIVIAEKAKLNSDLKLTIDDQYKDLKIKLSVTTIPNILEAETAVPVEGQISLSDIAQLDFNGDLGWPLSSEHKTKLKVALKGKSLKSLGDRFVVPQLAKAVPYYLNGFIEADNKFISLKKISSEIGELKWTGSLSWQQQAAPQKLTGDINVTYLDDEILTYFQPTTQSESKGEIQKPDFDRDIKLTVDEFSIQQVHLRNITNQTKIHAGKVHIVSEQGGNFIKSSQLDLKIDLNKKPWAYQVQGQANNISISKLLSLITEDDRVSGEIEMLKVDLSGVFVENKPLLKSKGVINVKNVNLAIKQDDDSTFPIMMDSAQLSLEGNKEVIIKLVAEESDDYEIPLDLTVTTNEKILTFFTSGEPLPLSLAFSANKAFLTAEGQVKYDGGKDDWIYQMKVKLKGPSVRKTVSLFEEDFDLEEKYQLTTTLNGNNSKLQLFDTDILLGNSSVKGELLAEKSAKRWLVTTKLTSDNIDINDILPTVVDDEHEKATSKEGKLLSDKPFNTSWLTYVDIDFDVNFNNITNGEILLGDYIVIANLMDGVLRTKVTVSGGYQKSNYDFELKAIDKALDLILLVDIKNFDLGTLLALTDLTDGVEGELDVDVEFQGRGKSVSQMISQGSGILRVDGGEGRISSTLLNLWGTGLTSSLLFTAAPNKNVDTKFNCGAAKFVLENGFFESQGIVLDTPETTMAGQIQIKLPEETPKFVVKPEPKKTSIVSIRTPVTVSGTVLEPKITVASDDALLTPFNMVVDFYATPFVLVKNVLSSDAENPCEEALSETGRAEKKGVIEVITSPIKAFFGVFKSKEPATQ
ncbi:MAG: hypothetical protein DRQ42_02790 [Gammaproteobacteria bacterium]|nr:MAG: hypothetical protein DRQ42_02790 [Gammaproteobacteria bacterium]